MLEPIVFPRRFVLWVAAALLILGVALSWRVSGLFESRGSTKLLPAGDSKLPIAPELAPGTWINSEPLAIKNLRGRVVLLDFWTFGCYNCRNTLPYVKSWNKRYGDNGLTVIGVHSPELDMERDLDNVKREVASLEIRYPVVTDNDYLTWKAYAVDAWPTMILVDKEGHIRWTHVGEGAYDEAEKNIQQLLGENSKKPNMETPR